MVNTQISIKDKIEVQKTLKVAKFDPKKNKTIPHKHNSYLEIIVLFEAKGVHIVDQKSYHVNSPVLFVVRKEQIHFWDLEENPNGYVVIIKQDFLDQCADGKIQALLQNLTPHTCSRLIQIERLQMLLPLLEEANGNRPYHSDYIEGLMKALLVEILENTRLTEPTRRKTRSLYAQYIDLLNDGNQRLIKVNDYARLLNTTPQNLNAVCQKAEGKSASVILAEHVMDEARRLLLYSNLNVTEIAFQLGFKDNSHFIKYFRRHSGTTPSRFRNPHQ